MPMLEAKLPSVARLREMFRSRLKATPERLKTRI